MLGRRLLLSVPVGGAGASVAWGWLGARPAADCPRAVCPRWHWLGRARASEPCSGSERVLSVLKLRSLNPLGLGRRGAMVRHEETVSLFFKIK